MLISASRRTDIPAYYSQWFFNRLKEGFVLVRNPMNVHQVSRIDLSPEVVDGIVFWTKNPLPMLNHLEELDGYPYYFQFTLNSYDRDVEANLPSKNQVLIPGFQKLSRTIGRERVVWRYDPIILNDRYTVEYHCRYFKVLAAKLGDYTEKCTVSFLDWYQNTARNKKTLKLRRETKEEQLEIMGRFSEIGKEYGFYIDTCAEAADFETLGIAHGSCIDRERLERIGKCKLSVRKDKNQRPECGCMESVDIGMYHTCLNGCLYCYANDSFQAAAKNMRNHCPKSPLLVGEVGAEDVVKERKMVSFRDGQMRLFDLVRSEQ